MDRNKLLRQLGEILSDRRLEHSLGVSQTAAALALRYNLDAEKAGLAGLLHDCARDMGESTLLERARGLGIAITPEDEVMPILLHGPVGAMLARESFGVTDPQILNAILLHSTGAPGMGPLERVIFMADKIEPGRKYKGVEILREAVYDDLNRGMISFLAHFINLSIMKQRLIHPRTISTWNWLVADGPGRNFGRKVE